MSKMPVRRPLGELDLGHRAWAAPSAAARWSVLSLANGDAGVSSGFSSFISLRASRVEARSDVTDIYQAGRAGRAGRGL